MFQQLFEVKMSISPQCSFDVYSMNAINYCAKRCPRFGVYSCLGTKECK